MPRERTRRNSTLLSATAEAGTGVWGKRRFSLGTYTGRLSGTTRTFRDPVKIDHNTRRRFSSASYSTRVAGATRTFRDPAVNADVFGTKTRGEEWSRATGTTTRHNSSSQEANLQEWLANKTTTSLENTGKWLELLEGRNKGDLDRDSPHDEEKHQGCDASVDEVELPHALRGAIEPSLGHMRDRGDKNDDEELSTTRGGVLRSKSRSSSSSVMCTDNQLLNIGERATAADTKDTYGNTIGDGVPRQVTFLSGTMGLTVDIDYPIQQQPPDGLGSEHQPHSDHDEQRPASPCSGVIQETSPRYGSLQAFRKEMASRGVNAQMFHTGWKGSFLPPRDIRLFMTDSRKSSVLYWRYKKKSSGRGGGWHLGAEDRRVIPLSSLANIGPAELYGQRAGETRRSGSRDPSSWIPIPPWLGRRGDDTAITKKEKEFGGIEKDEETSRMIEAIPVLALSYWVEGEPRWVGDKPKRLLVKPDSLDTFRRLTYGLRLCCLHFHNYSCPQDLEDIL